MQARSSATNDRYPYAVHGRVESAVFNCPRCALVLRFHMRTGIAQRCPGCSLSIKVGLRVSVTARSVTGINRAVRPPDTVLVPQLPGHAATYGTRPTDTIADPLGDDEIVAELADSSLDTALPLLALGVWEPGVPMHQLLIEDDD